MPHMPDEHDDKHEGDDGESHDVPADLLELHEVLEYMYAVETEGAP